MKPLTSEQIEQKKKQIEEGLYWEALELPRDSTMGTIEFRIFELIQANGDDPELVQMLYKVQRHFATGNYELVRKEVWDALFPKLDDDIARTVLHIPENEDISRQTIWATNIERHLNLPGDSPIVRIYSDLSSHFKDKGFWLAESGQEPPTEANTIENFSKAIKALKKSIYCFDLASTYISSQNSQNITNLLNQARDIEGQLELYARVQGYPVPGWPERRRTTTRETVTVKSPAYPTPKQPRPKPKPVAVAKPQPPAGGTAAKTATVTRPSSTVRRKPSARKSKRISIKKRWIAVLLAVFLGYLGADGFYLGRHSAWAKLSVSIATFVVWLVPSLNQIPGLLGLSALITILWWLLDILRASRV